MNLQSNIFIYVLTEVGESKPTIVSESKSKLETLLYEYMGIGPNFIEPQPKYIGFEPHDDRGYVNPFEGTYAFDTKDGPQYFLLYCVPLNELV